MKYNKDFWKKHGKKLLQSLLLGLAMELLIFNYRSWESLGFHKIQEFSIEYSEGSSVNADGTVEFDDEQAQVILSGIDQKVQNLWLDIQVLPEKIMQTNLQISVIDEGSAMYYKLPVRNLQTGGGSGNVIRLNLNGKVKSLQIELIDLKGEKIRFNQIGLNVWNPFQIDPARIVVVFTSALLFFFLRSLKRVYRETYDKRKSLHFGLCMALAAVQIGMVSAAAFGAADYVNPPWAHHYQYQKLAKSLVKGNFYLDEQPSKELMEMENPYDTQLRTEKKVPFLWDQAYYQGKYYVYFGIAPVLVFYLPYYLLTGQDFPTILGVLICEMALILGILFLLDSLVKRFFKKTTLGVFLLLDLLLFLGCGSMIIAKTPSFYCLPIVMGMALVVWGLFLWNESVCRERVSWKHLFWGSCCMALVAGCRPQMLLSSIMGVFLIVPALGRCLKKNKKDCMLRVVGGLVPFLAIAVFLMYYNYARFGSVIDFGANYNLTTNDMTQRGFRLDRTGLGIYMFLFQPFSFTTVFPFMTKVNMITLYQGITIYEPMYGGLFMLNPFLWVWLAIKKIIHPFKEKGLFGFIICAAVSGVLIVAADIQMAGILMRYTCDFAIFLCIPAVLIFLEYLNQVKSREFSLFLEKMLGAVTGITLVLTVLFLWT